MVESWTGCGTISRRCLPDWHENVRSAGARLLNFLGARQLTEQLRNVCGGTLACHFVHVPRQFGKALHLRDRGPHEFDSFSLQRQLDQLNSKACQFGREAAILGSKALELRAPRYLAAITEENSTASLDSWQSNFADARAFKTSLEKDDLQRPTCAARPRLPARPEACHFCSETTLVTSPETTFCRQCFDDTLASVFVDVGSLKLL